MILNRTTWAKKYEVTRGAVTLAVQSGGLISLPDGNIDEADPVNKRWIAIRKTRKKPGPQKTKKVEPAKQPEKIPPPFEGLPEIEEDTTEQPARNLDDADIGVLQAEKMRAEIRLKKEQEQAYRIGRLQKMGLLVEREEVRQTLGRFNAELRIRLLELPGTITPRIAAMLRGGASEHDIEVEIADDIGRAIEAAKAVVTGAGF